MPPEDRNAFPVARSATFVALAAGGLWLALLNALLIFVLLWIDPRRMATVLAALARATAAVLALLWTSPWAALVVVAVLVSGGISCAGIVVASQRVLGGGAPPTGGARRG